MAVAAAGEQCTDPDARTAFTAGLSVDLEEDSSSGLGCTSPESAGKRGPSSPLSPSMPLPFGQRIRRQGRGSRGPVGAASPGGDMIRSRTDDASWRDDGARAGRFDTPAAEAAAAAAEKEEEAVRKEQRRLARRVTAAPEHLPSIQGTHLPTGVNTAVAAATAARQGRLATVRLPPPPPPRRTLRLTCGSMDDPRLTLKVGWCSLTL